MDLPETYFQTDEIKEINESNKLNESNKMISGIKGSPRGVAGRDNCFYLKSLMNLSGAWLGVAPGRPKWAKMSQNAVPGN